MERIEFDCGNGWKVRVDVASGTPQITAELTVGDRVIADTVIPVCVDGRIAFSPWHPAAHRDEWTASPPRASPMPAQPADDSRSDDP